MMARNSPATGSAGGKQAATSFVHRVHLGVKGFTDRLAHKGDRHQGGYHGPDDREADPPGTEIRPGLLQQFAPAGRGRRQAEAQVVQRGQRHDAAGNGKGDIGDDQGNRVGQDVTKNDAQVRCAQDPCGQHIIPGLFLVGHRANGPGHAHPTENHHDGDQPPEIGHDNGRNDDHHIEEGNGRPNLDDALHQDIEPAAIISHGAAKADPHDISRRHQSQGEEDRDAESVNQTGQNISTGSIRAQVMPARQGRRLGWQGIRSQIVLKGIVGHGGQPCPILAIQQAESLGQLAVVGLVIVAQPKGMAGQNITVGRKVPVSLVVHHQGTIVDQKLRRAGRHDQGGQQEKGIVAAFDADEAPELPFCQGGYGHFHIAIRISPVGRRRPRTCPTERCPRGTECWRWPERPSPRDSRVRPPTRSPKAPFRRC
ncbi:hypothetical protein DESC_460033 [Desulfosarcina cetonica]|nr:hypothetical protein DESC_460033 [Desulfosarcina cetonica]